MRSPPGYPHADTVHFGRFEVRIAQRQVVLDSAPLAIGARAFDLLVALIQRRGRVLSRNELIDLVWPGLVVEENNLSVQIGTLRRLLGTDVITTVPGRGYCFTGALARARPDDDEVPEPTLPPPRLKSNLPATLPRLTGRDADLVALHALLDDAPAAGIVTVVGAGGIGKTRLAMAALAARASRYRHGVCLIELAAVASGDQLVGAIAAGLGLERSDGGAGREPLLQAMDRLQMLVLLDNAEHLLAEVACFAAHVRDRAPGVRLLVTSQAPLRVAGEQVFRLDALALPPPDAQSAEAARAFGAVALFVERASAADRRFALTDANVRAVVALCAQLDALPLALELAAARVPWLGVQGLIDQMTQRFVLLSAGGRDAPTRQRTLHNALAWSHALLGPVEQRVFRRLGMVVGTASMRTVQEIAAEAGEEDWVVTEALGTLVDRSLVIASDGDPPRYRVLESPRSFALERLRAAGEEAGVAARHAHSLRGTFERATQAIVRLGQHQGGVIALLLPELDDARAAMVWATQHDVPTALSLMIGIGIVLSCEGATALGAPPELLALADSAEVCDGLPAVHVAWWAFNYSDYQRSDSRLPAQGPAWCERAIALARRHRDAAALQLALTAQATHLTPEAPATHPAPEAPALQPLLDEIARLDGPSATPLLRTAQLSMQSLHHWRTGETLQATQCVERLVAILDAQGAVATARIARTSLIAFWLGLARFDAALAIGRALLAETRGTRNLRGLADCRRHVVTALLLCGQRADARELLLEAWHDDATQFSRTHPGWRDQLALLAALEQRPRAAALLLGASDRAWADSGRPRGKTSSVARDCAAELAARHLSAAMLAQLQAHGQSMGGDALDRLALATDDAAVA